MTSFLESGGSLLNCHDWFPIDFPFTGVFLPDPGPVLQGVDDGVKAQASSDRNGPTFQEEDPFRYLCSAKLRHETGLSDPGLASNRDNPSRAVDEAVDLKR